MHAQSHIFKMSGLKLKLNVNTSVPSSSSAPTPATPSATPGGVRAKLKLTNKSVPPTPAAEQPKPKKTKGGRATKPSAKLIESRKRTKDESDEEEGSTIQVAAPQTANPPTKKIKLSIGPKTPIIPKTPAIQTPVVLKAKVKGKPPVRPLGDGYDSEASDREEDPAIEEQIILRMVEGEDCKYLKKMIAEKRIGEPVSKGGADVHMKFFADGRRAAITIRNNIYAATLVDLPTVIEAMKSWDKRNWLKSADICQMLWVFDRIKKEEDAKTIPLPAEVDEKTWQYPHGLTAPMYHARRNRFRHRLHKTQIEEVEDEVNRLLAADSAARDTHAIFIDPEAENRRASQAFSPASSDGDYDMEEQQYSQDRDAEGEVDETGYFNGKHHGEDQEEDAQGEFFDLDAELQDHPDVETPMSAAATPSQANGAASTQMEEDSGDESGEGDEEDDEDEEDEIDEEEKARLAQIEGTREDIADLEKQISNVQTQLTGTTNPILRKRLDDNMRKLKQELQLKKSSIGEGEENE